MSEAAHLGRPMQRVDGRKTKRSDRLSRRSTACRPYFIRFPIMAAFNRFVLGRFLLRSVLLTMAMLNSRMNHDEEREGQRCPKAGAGGRRSRVCCHACTRLRVCDSSREVCNRHADVGGIALSSRPRRDARPVGTLACRPELRPLRRTFGPRKLRAAVAPHDRRTRRARLADACARNTALRSAW